MGVAKCWWLLTKWVDGGGQMLTWAKKKIQRKKNAFHNFFDKNINGVVVLILIYFWNKIIRKTYPSGKSFYSQNKYYFCPSFLMSKKNRWVGFQKIWCNIKKCWRLLIRWVGSKKPPKTCWHNIWMVPRQEKQFVRSLRWSWRVH